MKLAYQTADKEISIKHSNKVKNYIYRFKKTIQ